MQIPPVVSELIEALKGTDGQANMTKLIGVFLTMRTRVKLNIWNVSLPFFFYGRET